jgi:hypothetical protein
MQFDLHALFATPIGLLRVPLFLVLFLVVRGAPALLLYRGDLPRYQLVPLAFFSATGLPLIVVITTIGVEEGRMRPVNAAALVAAGMLSVLLYPMIARMWLRRASTRTPPTESDSGMPEVEKGSPAIAPCRSARPAGISQGLAARMGPREATSCHSPLLHRHHVQAGR